MNNELADRPSARVETKGPTVTAGESPSLAAAVGLEVPLAQLCAMDRLRRLRDKLLVLNSSDDEYNLTDQDEHDLLRLVEERMAREPERWKPIADAPTNGLRILCVHRPYSRVFIARARMVAESVTGNRYVWEDDHGMLRDPNYWRYLPEWEEPLPAPPAVKGV